MTTLRRRLPSKFQTHRQPAAPRAFFATLRIIVLLAAFIATAGCKVVILSGPAKVATGETVVYVLEVSSDAVPFDRVPFVIAEVPLGWQLQSSTYTATVSGQPVAGSGMAEVVVHTVCEFDFPPAGFQRLRIVPESPVDDLTYAERGEVTLEFLVTDQPSGAYDIAFNFGTSQECSPPAPATVNGGTTFLRRRQTLVDGADGVDGLAGVGRVEPSPDGRFLYVAGAVDAAVGVYSRDAASGALSFLASQTNGAADVTNMAVPLDLEMSPDGEFLYVGSLSNLDTFAQGGVTVFSRDPASGALGLVESYLEDVEHLLASPDGRHLYGADYGITAYVRSEVSGLLSFAETIFPGGQLLTSADGGHVYSVSSSGGGTRIYSRDESSGELTETAGAYGFAAAALSADGRHFYGISESISESGCISVYERDQVTGELSFAFRNPIGTRFTSGIASLAISSNGSHVVLGSSLGLFLYSRNPASGQLTLLEAHYSSGAQLIALEGPRALRFSPDDRHLFASSFENGALVVFETAVLFHDGFESGDTAAWSGQVGSN